MCSIMVRGHKITDREASVYFTILEPLLQVSFILRKKPCNSSKTGLRDTVSYLMLVFVVIVCVIKVSLAMLGTCMCGCVC